MVYESGNELVVECENEKCIFVCPRCGETRDVSGLSNHTTVHCCKKEGKKWFANPIPDSKIEKITSFIADSYVSLLFTFFSTLFPVLLGLITIESNPLEPPFHDAFRIISLSSLIVPVGIKFKQKKSQYDRTYTEIPTSF